MGDDDAYRRLFDSHPVAMAIWDPADGRILAINDAAAHQYRYTREQAIGTRIDRLIHPDDLDRLRRRLATMPTGHVRGDTFRHLRSDGTVIEVEMTGHELEFEGRPARVVMAVDVTERRALEERVQHAERMEAVGRLAGGVAHDFNNLLMVINGFSELLVERLPPGEEREAAQQIRAAGDRAAELTRQLLTFAEVGMQRLEVVDAAELLTEFLPELHRVVGDSIDIAVDVSAVRPSIEVDRGQLRQAFHNLVVNARDAMSGSGRLAITLEDASPDLETSIEAPAGALLVSVADSGPGIPEANRERVFLPFFTTHADRGATGLGLALVFATVRGAGGRVWVERAAGPGTVIRLLIPRAAGGPAQQAGEPPAD